MLSESDLSWHSSEVASSGEALVKAVVDSLWLIDGHHDVFASRGYRIPACFNRFSGYNRPELTKHRKRTRENMNATALRLCGDALFGCLQDVYWHKHGWKEFKANVELLATSLSKYSEYLDRQCTATKQVHSSQQPVRQIAENIAFTLLPKSPSTSPTFEELEKKLEEKELFEHILVEDTCPNEPRRKYEFIQMLMSSGIAVETALLTYSHGNNIGNLHFIWKVSGDDLTHSQRTIEKVKEEIPVFHTRAMRKALFSKFGRVTPSIKPAILRALYRELTSDASAPTNQLEAEIDERVKRVLDMEDPDIVIDLRHLNTGKKSQYDVFWEHCKNFLHEDVGSAVDDRRHAAVTHLARAISVRDLRDQVKLRCPQGTPIPSEPWIRLQFWPKTPHARSKIHYTGRLDVRFMVQARQFRKTHADAHYAAALFRYEKELAIEFREYSMFVSIDDKHRIKIGEPGFPVAAAERGRRVVVGRDVSFQVGITILRGSVLFLL